MNQATFIGNLTKNFEIRRTQEGLAIARGGMALNRGKDKNGNDKGADFINLVAYGKTAEVLEKYGLKGRKFGFETSVRTGLYEKDGTKVYTTDFVINRIEFLDYGNNSAEKPATTTDDSSWQNIVDAIDEDELPFN